MFKLKDLINEDDLGYTTKKGKTIRAVHKTSGKEIVVIDNPASRKRLKRMGFNVVGETVTEKKELGGALINKIERLTDVNNHNEARLVLAKEMKLRILVKGYESLIVLHTIFNQMNELMSARHKLDKMLFAQAKRVYSDYDQIYGAF